MSGKPRVLFVDDYADFVDMLPIVFRNAPFEVQTAHSGEEAVAKLGSPELARTFPDGTERCPFDLIVLDVAMPGINGPTCALSMLRLFPLCEFVFLTGHAEHLQNELGAEEIAPLNIPVWEKPISPTDLGAYVVARLKALFI